MFNPFRPPGLADNPQLEERLQVGDAFDPKPEVSDSVEKYVLDYSRDKYEEFEKSYSELDDKATRLLQFIGAFVAVMVAGFVGTKTTPPIFAAVPFVIFILDMCLLSRIVAPHYRKSTSTAKALLAALKTSRGFKLWMARHYYETTERFLVAYTWKADRLALAYWMFALGVALLAVIPFLKFI